jgi:hypothetical protein
MLAKKVISQATQGRSYRRELDYLYARKSAVDTLIQSLQEYDRFRARSSARVSKRKSA